MNGLNQLLGLFPRRLSARLPLIAILSFLAGALAAWFLLIAYQNRQTDLQIAEMTGGILARVIEQNWQVEKNMPVAIRQGLPYEVQHLEAFPANPDVHVIPLILSLDDLRVRAAVQFKSAPPRPGLLRANPDNSNVDANMRLSSLSHGIARQDMEASLLIFLSDDSVLLIEAPQIWHDRLSEAKSMLLALIGIIGMLAAIFPLSLSLTIPFKKLAQKRENPRASLGSFASEEAIAIQDHINSLQRQFDREQESQIQSLASISHDLRTPVTRLRLRAEIMKEKEMQEKFLSDLEEISCLVEGALDLLSVRKLPEDHFKFSLDSLIQSLCDDYCDIGKDVRFALPEQIEIGGVASVFGGTAPVLVSAETHGMMIGQPKKLRRALVNLIDNSLKYGRYADISLGYDGSDHLIIRITDGGPGIPAEKMDQVMLPFVRGHWSKLQRGSGLGLSIANEIIKHHKGELSLKNGSDGLLVEVHLPREQSN